MDDLANTRVNADRIQNVENCFGSSGQPLRAVGRVLVGEGVLTKMCRKKSKPRQVFLFNDILVYGNILIQKKKYIKQHIIPLEKVCLENIEDTSDLSHGWVIRTPTKSFVVYAASKKEKQQWMTHINTCINELLKKTGKHPSKEHAAVWVPDADAGKCMVCKETKFTLLNRRHHCRKCGCVVCGNCSQHKFMLPVQSSKPLRVCDTCYNTLSMGKGDFADMDLLPKKPALNQSNSKLLASSKGDSSRDDTTDDSDDDEEDAPDAVAEPAELKEEKWIFQPTFYSNEDPAKETRDKEKSATLPKEKGDESIAQTQEKMDAIKITTERRVKDED
ncbi:pleckstrin homology domain-containing family F member 2-like [Tropilaelaps mercedesae]|uniref:Pleckstrin homology domain-containing family F member 2-like n=1 Tax=Tropilaelaps mercedesae TaxID=418985 RepID=A0A1V9XV70_9ACAR|nr:pleckstrin homology domain-containing family F member 2-like [Tropilaelaps mercedesae]